MSQSIKQLVEQLEPIRRPRPVYQVAALWLLLGSAYVGVTTFALGPFRSGLAAQLTDYPVFLVEMLVGLGALFAFCVTALKKSVPGDRTTLLPWILGLMWLGFFIVGFVAPVLEPSMSGKRTHCAWEAYLLSVPPWLGLVWLQRRRFTLQPAIACTYAAIAAGILPALIMQIACMYEPAHILQFHILPIGILALFAFLSQTLLARFRPARFG